jgi:transposase InsO family protein
MPLSRPAIMTVSRCDVVMNLPPQNVSLGSLKVERLHGQRFETIRQAKDETIAWLLWYNQTRMHSTLHYASPMQFERDWMDATMTIAA